MKKGQNNNFGILGCTLLAAAAIVLILTVQGCSKEKTIQGLWQQAHHTITFTDETGGERNATDSAVTLLFQGEDTVFISVGNDNALLHIPPADLTDSLREAIGNLCNNLGRDTTTYALSDNTLTLGSRIYDLEKLTGRWLEISIDDSVENRPVRRYIKFIHRR
ncbi:MAG: hypothetical protein IJL38_02715 [Bacteroidales bacterium]|nr:hypothetical protein [Bacteroidales bacterium]